MTAIARYPDIYAYGKGRSLQVLPQYASDVLHVDPHPRSVIKATPFDLAAAPKSGSYIPIRRNNSRLRQ